METTHIISVAQNNTYHRHDSLIRTVETIKGKSGIEIRPKNCDSKSNGKITKTSFTTKIQQKCRYDCINQTKRCQR